MRAWVEKLRPGQRFALAGAVATVLGSFLPWAKVTAPLVGTMTVSGIEGNDGFITVVLGIAAGVLAYLWTTPRRQPAEWLIGLGGVITLFAVYEWIDIGADLRDVEFVSGSRGSGLFVVLLGGILVTAGGVLLRRAPAE